MFSSPPYFQKPNTGRASSLLLKYLNTGTLAFVMFVAFTLLTSTRGKESEIRDLGSTKNTKAEVVIDNFSFSPKTLMVPVGATVTWVNHDSVPHVVMSAHDQFKKSPVLKEAQHFSNTFATTGTYSYLCSIHPRMTGKIIVN